MPFYRLNKEYIQQGIYMSETTEPSTNQTGAANTKILSLVSQNAEDEPIGFALLMTPYKAKLLDVEALASSFVQRSQQVKEGKSTPASTEQIKESVKENISAPDLKFSPTLYTTKQVNLRDVPRIIFPLPVDIRDQLMVNYQTSDMGAAGAIASFGSDLARNIKQGKGLDMGTDTVSSALSALALNAIKNTSVAPLAGQYLGAVANPFTVTSFRNVEPRVFNFEFRITPANIEQSETLQECINTLRFCALPDPSDSGLTLAIPYRFKLAWLGALKMFDFSEAVLSRIEVNYSAGGTPAFFEYKESSIEGVSGGYHPVTATVVLEFRELFPLTKETVFPRAQGSNYDGEMRPRRLGRNEIESENKSPPPSSPETQGGATTTDPAENQTGTGDNALNTPTADDRATVEQAQAVLNDSAQRINAASGTLKNEGEGGYDAIRASQGLIPASDVYLNVNRHNAGVNSYNNALDVLKANPLSSSYVKDIPFQQTWFEKLESGTSGSRTNPTIWTIYYNQGKADWNKTSGGGG
jgi:hypothetical protein